MTTRNVRPFVHLRVLSSYSLGLGLSSPGDVCRHARRSGFGAVALTDVSGTYGFVELHRAAREANVKPIYGTLVFLDWNLAGHAGEPVQSLIVLALDRTGLRNVCAIASASAVRRERREGLFASNLDGLTDGVIAITHVDPAASGLSAEHLLGPLHDLFGERLFVEIHPRVPAAQRASQKGAMAAATALGVMCVLTQDVRFVGPARPQLFDLMASLDEPGFEHRVFSDRRAGDAAPDHGMTTAAEISEAYVEFPDAFTNASLIASLVQPDLLDTLEAATTADAPEMFVLPARGVSFRTRIEGLNERASAALKPKAREVERARVAHELTLIESAGLESTFERFERLSALLKEIGARLGPATGLSVQSRTAFLLGITSFDPYELDARFEPSFETREPSGSIFDLQISPEDRPAVLAIVNRAFAGASVGYVPSVEHLTAARSMRMVAKWLSTPTTEIDEAVRIAGRFHGNTLRQLAETNRAFGALYRRSAGFRDLVAHAASVEGLPFGFVRAKRTVIVSPRPLRDFFAHTISPTTGDHFVQATRDSFPLGPVLRIDLSLLRVLAILPASTARKHAPPAAYELIANGDLEGVYLLEGAPGRLAPTFGIHNFDDLVHFVALLRRRGSGQSLAARLSAFRKDPRTVPAASVVGNVLDATRGWVLFADQMRDVVAALTGWTRTEADAFLARLADRAPGNLAARRHEFFKQTVEQSVPLEDATEWFARLVRESESVVERQRVIAECLLSERCLEARHADPTGFAKWLNDHTGDRRMRYEPPSRVGEAEATGEQGPPIPAASGPEEQLELSSIPEPAPQDLFGVLGVEGGSHSRIPETKRNPNEGFIVLATVSEFYPHPASTPVQLAGRIRNLQTFRSSAEKKVGYFELIDSSGSVRVYVPAEPYQRFGSLIKDGSEVVVRGAVRRRDGRKVCDALEIADSEGGISLGKASTDRSSTRDP
jgi:DNA polymerase-3 subunit alpha